METPASRINLSIIVAACIIAVGLVSSARILAQRPVPGPNDMPARPVTAATTVQRLALPPFTQESVKEQIRAQTLAAPNMQTYRFHGVVYRLSDVTVSEVSYSAKDDAFFAILNRVWLPAMPADGPNSTAVSLNNNGYNQYAGAVFLSPEFANICIK